MRALKAYALDVLDYWMYIMYTVESRRSTYEYQLDHWMYAVYSVKVRCTRW